MDKKEFFESLVSLSENGSCYRIEAFWKIREAFADFKSELWSSELRNKFERIEKEVLSHVWAFEQICNADMSDCKKEDTPFWPLIVISVSGKIIFVNRVYCLLSGLSPEDVRFHTNAGTLYEQVYEWEDLKNAHAAVSRLHAGKGYENLELTMKHSGQKIAWNSYGWIGKSIEIRSGKVVCDETDQKKERERFYRGSVGSTARLLENLYQVCINGNHSKENEERLVWIQEFLSMFDFLWNHSELFMEILDIPTSEEGEASGCYNTVYAQFLRHSFEERKKFKITLSLAHGMLLPKFLETRNVEKSPFTGEQVFHQYNKIPVAFVCWHSSVYPYEWLDGYYRVFSFGMLVRKIPKRNFLVRLFRAIFRK